MPLVHMDLVTLTQAVCKSKALQDSGDEALVYGCFAIIFMFAAKFLSDWKFSAIITVGAAVQLLGFCLLRMKVRKQNGVQGISSRSLQLFICVYCCRLFSTLQYNGYLPVDRSGDWVYQACEVMALLVAVSLLVTIHGKHDATYEKENDTCAIMGFLGGAAVLAYLVHPSLNNRALPDCMWTVALYLEAVAMVPQLFMLSKRGGAVESFAGHYVACVFTSRLLMITFWFHSYPELKLKNSEYNLPGYGVVGAQIFQLALFCDFMYYYAKSWSTSTALVLPESTSV